MAENARTEAERIVEAVAGQRVESTTIAKFTGLPNPSWWVNHQRDALTAALAAAIEVEDEQFPHFACEGCDCAVCRLHVRLSALRGE